ncbi:MAG: hypothetical protein WC891_04130 [Actinomycetota bacterium]
MRQKLIVWLLAFYMVLIGGVAWASAPVVATVFYILLVAQILIHTFWLCPRCGNDECAINPKSPYFIFMGRRKAAPVEKLPARNMTLPVTMLGLTMLVGLYAIWLLSPIVSYSLAWAGAMLVYAYSRVACSTCQNICIMSRRKQAG